MVYLYEVDGLMWFLFGVLVVLVMLGGFFNILVFLFLFGLFKYVFDIYLGWVIL